jgi:flagellar motor switch protein FliG
MFLMGVGENVSAEVLRQLTPDEVRRISSEISGTRAVGADDMLSVFREFESLTVEGRLFAQGGVDCARRMVESALGPESAQKLLAAGVPAPISAAGRDALENTDPKQLAAFLKKEHPQTIAVLLSTLSPESGSTLLETLPEEIHGEVASRMASLDRISPEAFQKVTEAIGNKLSNIRKITKADGVRALAALLNRLDTARSDAILNHLESQNPSITDSIRSLMFVFEDIVTIDKEGMKALVGKLDRKIMTTALKGTSAKIRDHFTQCMSQRSSEMLTEDMEALGPIRIRDVEVAQQQVISIVRELQQSGVISANRGGGGDEYVV